MLMNHAGGIVEHVTVEMLDDKLLGKFVIVHRRDELLKLFESLLAQVAAVDKKEHAAAPAFLINRYVKLTAVNVLPEPVAI